MLIFGWDFKVNAWSRFRNWSLIKMWWCDVKLTLGSVVPLALFFMKMQSNFEQQGTKVKPIISNPCTIVFRLLWDFNNSTRKIWTLSFFSSEIYQNITTSSGNKLQIENQIYKTINRAKESVLLFDRTLRFYVPYLVWLTFPSQEMKRTLSSKDGFRALSHPNWLVKALICADVGKIHFQPEKIGDIESMVARSWCYSRTICLRAHVPYKDIPDYKVL